MNVFVTGGAGYVGSHCVKALLAAGHRATVFDNLSAGHRKAVDPRAAFIQGDLARPDEIRAALDTAPFDAVMHFAAYLNVGESVQQPLKYYRNNVANTLHLLEAVHAAGIRRFVFSSTCAVYGRPTRLPITEDLPLEPINPYGATKLAVERMLADCAAAWGLGAVALRYFNAAGASSDGSIGEDHDPELHLIPLVLQVALGRRDSLHVFGDDYPTPDGTCVRDYIHVEDLAAAHVLALERMAPGRFVGYNVGTGRGHSVLEVIQAARAVTGHAIPVVRAARRPGDPPVLYADSDKLRRELGWSPQHTDLHEVIASAWAWHKTHPRGFAAK